MKYESSEFYCINCGKRGIPLPRLANHKRERFHRKKMYCPNCRQVVNFVECKTPEDVELFKEEFENGAFRKEAEESLSYVRSTRLGEIDLDKTADGGARKK